MLILHPCVPIQNFTYRFIDERTQPKRKFDAQTFDEYPCKDSAYNRHESRDNGRVVFTRGEVHHGQVHEQRISAIQDPEKGKVKR